MKVGEKARLDITRYFQPPIRTSRESQLTRVVNSDYAYGSR